ncbi:MAG: hypothetical protein K2Y71_04585 [Xanthobacteraceae bacterium]|nr:hypothetical protein [Xanthobacteraceae bacterium]
MLDKWVEIKKEREPRATVAQQVGRLLKRGLRSEMEIGGHAGWSQVVKLVLDDEIESLAGWRSKHLYALGRFVAHTASHLEGVLGYKLHAGKRWSDDPFAARVLPTAIETVLHSLTPSAVMNAPVDIPEEARRYAEMMARRSPEKADHYSTPEAFGAMIGLSVALQIQEYATRKSYPPDDDDAADDAAVIDGGADEWMPQMLAWFGSSSIEEGRK